MPSKEINTALEVLSDVIKNPLFDETELEKEKKVIFEEIKMRKDNPAVYVIDNNFSFLYEKPFGTNIIGDYNTVGNITKKDLIEKFNKSYATENLVLCVVGDANFEEIVEFAEKNFKKTGGEILKIIPKEINKEKIEEREGVNQANLAFSFHVPTINDNKNYAAQLLSCIMGNGLSSRLFIEIREKRNLAYAIKGYSEISKNFAYNLIFVGTMKENVEKVKKLILEEYEKVSKNLSKKELKQAKEQLIGNFNISLEDSQSQLVNLINFEIEKNAEDFYEYQKNIANVKLEDVKEIADIKKYGFFALVPKE